MTYYLSKMGIPLRAVNTGYYLALYTVDNLCLDSYADENGKSTHHAFTIDMSTPVDPEGLPTVESLKLKLYEAVGHQAIAVVVGGCVDFYTSVNIDLRVGYGYGTYSYGDSRHVIAAFGGAFIGDVFVPYADIKKVSDVIDCPVSEAWGGAKYSDCVDYYRLNLNQFFRDYVSQKYLYRIQFTQAEMSKKFQGKISMYLNKKDKDRDRKTALRPGRAFKFLFPEMNAAEIERLVDDFNRAYPVVNLTLHEGCEEADFIKAYSYEQSVMQNVYTTCSRKSLANSCMRLRPEHENLPKHPSAAYASGDFLSLWTEDDRGKIASRCVVYTPEGKAAQAGPIYGTTEFSIDMIQERLIAMGALLYEDASWVGAKLLNIPCNGGVLAPYLDHEKGLKEDGDYLVVTSSESNADYLAETYSGVLHGGSVCTDCGDSVDDNDRMTNSDGECFCPDCYSDRYATCYESYEECRREDMVLCRISNSRWGWNEELVHNPEFYDYTYIDGHYYHPDVVVTTEQGNSFLLDSDDYFICDLTEEYHDIDQMVETVDGDTTSLDWVKANNYIMNEDGVYAPQEEKEAA